MMNTPPKRRPNIFVRAISNGVYAVLFLALLALGGLAAVVSAALAGLDRGDDQDAEL